MMAKACIERGRGGALASDVAVRAKAAVNRTQSKRSAQTDRFGFFGCAAMATPQSACCAGIYCRGATVSTFTGQSPTEVYLSGEIRRNPTIEFKKIMETGVRSRNPEIQEAHGGALWDGSGPALRFSPSRKAGWGEKGCRKSRIIRAIRCGRHSCRSQTCAPGKDEEQFIRLNPTESECSIFLREPHGPS